MLQSIYPEMLGIEKGTKGDTWNSLEEKNRIDFMGGLEAEGQEQEDSVGMGMGKREEMGLRERMRAETVRTGGTFEWQNGNSEVETSYNIQCDPNEGSK